MSTSTTSPYFSVIIPCLNEEKYLPKLLHCLNTQLFEDFDVHVVDGKSEDKTAQIVKDYKSTYPLYLHSTPTRCASYQRNLGASHATGKVLIFFDADTTIPSNYLSRIHATYETKKPHFLTTYLDVDSHKPSEKWFALLNNFIFETGKILKTPFALGAMQSVKRAAFEDIGGYDEDTKFAEDTQLFQKLLDYNYKYIILPSPRYIFSLRRLRSEGTLETMTQYLKLNLNIFLNGYHYDNIDYEMGGTRYNETEAQKTEYVRSLQPLLHKLTHPSKKQNENLKNLLNRLFSTKYFTSPPKDD